MAVKIRVLNKGRARRGLYGVYIGRGSPLGNPFIIGKDGTRAEVIDKYKPYLENALKEGNPVIVKAMNDISEMSMQYAGVNLLCHCKPKRCHGDVIKSIIEDVAKAKGV